MSVTVARASCLGPVWLCTKRIVHGICAEEFELEKGTVCSICLKELWTVERLRAQYAMFRVGGNLIVVLWLSQKPSSAGWLD